MAVRRWSQRISVANCQIYIMPAGRKCTAYNRKQQFPPRVVTANVVYSLNFDKLDKENSDI